MDGELLKDTEANYNQPFVAMEEPVIVTFRRLTFSGLWSWDAVDC
jgi:hypothetical protein